MDIVRKKIQMVISSIYIKKQKKEFKIKIL